jgi:hypothetical protein
MPGENTGALHHPGSTVSLLLQKYKVIKILKTFMYKDKKIFTIEIILDIFIKFIKLLDT